MGVVSLVCMWECRVLSMNWVFCWGCCTGGVFLWVSFCGCLFCGGVFLWEGVCMLVCGCSVCSNVGVCGCFVMWSVLLCVDMMILDRKS